MQKKKIVSDLSHLSTIGFTAVVQTGQKFNVICVSKYSFDDKKIGFHFPADGGDRARPSKEVPESVEIEVKQVLYTRADITVTETVVSYQGKDYALRGISNGLSGSSLCIGIYNEEERGYDIWWLYTDTPSTEPDRSGEVVTGEELRKRAKDEIGRNGQYDRHHTQ